MKTYIIDIDGTICDTIKGDYVNSTPIKWRIAQINKLYDEGHQIIFNTARGFKTGTDWLELTQKQLADWGVKYHSLFMGKPYGDYYIDDKAVPDWKFFE